MENVKYPRVCRAIYYMGGDPIALGFFLCLSDVLEEDLFLVIRFQGWVRSELLYWCSWWWIIRILVMHRRCSMFIRRYMPWSLIMWKATLTLPTTWPIGLWEESYMSQNLAKAPKISVYLAALRPAMLNGSESKTLTQALGVFERKVLIAIYRMQYRGSTSCIDYVGSQESRQSSKQV